MDTDPISGEWEATITTPDQTRSLRMMLMLEGTQVSGRLESEQGVQTLQMGEFAEDRLKLSVPSDNGEMEFSGQLDGNRLAGDFNLADREQGSWQAVKM